MASEIETESSLKNSFLSWKWQWLLDQRKQFNDRVDQYMNKLHDKFFTCADFVKEHHLIEAAVTFLSQPVPDIDTPIPQDEAKKSFPQTEEIERLQNAVKELQEGSQKQKDELAQLSAQTQKGLDKTSSLERRLQRLDETTDRIQEGIKKNSDKQMREMKTAVDQLKKRQSKKQQKDRRTLSELKNSQKLALKACAQHLAGLASSHKATTTTATLTAAATATQVVASSGDNQKLALTTSTQNSDSSPQKTAKLGNTSSNNTPAVSQGATSLSVTPCQALAKRPKAATVLHTTNLGFTPIHVELLSGGCLLFTHRKQLTDGTYIMALSLYNGKFEYLQSFCFDYNFDLTLIVIQEPLVAVIDLKNRKLHLMHVTESKISIQSTHNLGKSYSSIALVDTQTLAAVYGDPAIGVDVIDLKGQVKSTFCTDHKVFGIYGTGVGSILCSGDKCISGYDMKTQTKMSCLKGKQIHRTCQTGTGDIIWSGYDDITRYDMKTLTKIFSCKVDQVPCPRAITYLPDSDTIIVYDYKTNSLCLLDGSTGFFISHLNRGVGYVDHIVVPQAGTLVYIYNYNVIKICKMFR